MNTHNRIHWQTGMEITPQVLTDADNFHIEQRNLIRRLQVMPCYGLLPESDFNADISIKGDTVIVKNLLIHAITSQGEQIDKEYVEEDMSQYVKDSLLYLDNTFAMPIAKINSQIVDCDYIPPCISINSNKKLLDIFAEICEKTSTIAEQIKEQEKYKPLLLPFLLLELELKNYSTFESPNTLFLLMKKIAMLCKLNIPETLENTELLCNEIYCHTDMYSVFSVVLGCLYELEEKTLEEEKPKIQRIRIGK